MNIPFEKILSPIWEANGVTAYAGIFKLKDTYGLGLGMITLTLKNNSAIPCWISFCKDAAKQGWSHRKTMAQIGEAIRFAFNPAAEEKVIYWLERGHALGRLYK